LSIIQPGEVDMNKVNDWVGDILQSKGADIFRMKGVLAIANSAQKFVYQAVHMIFNGDFDEEWEPGEERVSKLVFIGKNLDHEELKKGFAACKFDEGAAKELRFGVGSRVQCRTNDGWKAGEVVKVLYREQGMPEGFVAPYQVKLDAGQLIYVPKDINELCRKDEASAS